MKTKELKITLSETIPHPTQQYANMKPELSVVIEPEHGENPLELLSWLRNKSIELMAQMRIDCIRHMTQTAAASGNSGTGTNKPPMLQPTGAPQQVGNLTPPPTYTPRPMINTAPADGVLRTPQGAPTDFVRAAAPTPPTNQPPPAPQPGEFVDPTPFVPMTMNDGDVIA